MYSPLIFCPKTFVFHRPLNCEALAQRRARSPISSRPCRCLFATPLGGAARHRGRLDTICGCGGLDPEAVDWKMMWGQLLCTIDLTFLGSFWIFWDQFCSSCFFLFGYEISTKSLGEVLWDLLARLRVYKNHAGSIAHWGPRHTEKSVRHDSRNQVVLVTAKSINIDEYTSR